MKGIQSRIAQELLGLSDLVSRNRNNLTVY